MNLVPYALVVAAFAAFVFWNGGIVLGECHRASLCCESGVRVHVRQRSDDRGSHRDLTH